MKIWMENNFVTTRLYDLAGELVLLYHCTMCVSLNRHQKHNERRELQHKPINEWNGDEAFLILVLGLKKTRVIGLPYIMLQIANKWREVETSEKPDQGVDV